MGNSSSIPSTSAFKSLDAELPPVKKMEYDDNYLSVDRGMGVFADKKDREQFIHAILAVATSNGMLDFDGADFKLFYSRRSRQQAPAPASIRDATDEKGDEYLVATLAAIKDNKIIAKIEPSTGGASQKEAFLALRRAVEVRLEEILQGVPSASTNSSVRSSMQSENTLVPDDLPPSYQSSAVGMMATGGPERSEQRWSKGSSSCRKNRT